MWVLSACHLKIMSTVLGSIVCAGDYLDFSIRAIIFAFEVLTVIIFHYIHLHLISTRSHLTSILLERTILLTRISGLNNYIRTRLPPWDFLITLFRSFRAYNYFSRVRDKSNIDTLNATFSPLALRLIIDILESLCGESLAQLLTTFHWSRSRIIDYMWTVYNGRMLNHAFARKNHRYSEAYLAETIHLMEIARAQESLILINSSKAMMYHLLTALAIFIDIFIIKNVVRVK